MNLAVVALLYTGAIRVNAGALTQGQLVALYNYMSQILVELIKFANLIITMTKAAACGNRIQDVFSVRPGQISGTCRPKGELRGQVEFRHAAITYQKAGAEALSDVSFLARPGQTVGIIGGTGSGKSTLVNLIPPILRRNPGGQVLVDGVDVQDWDMEALRRRIAVVPQKAVLFRGTIRSNLLWGREDATQAELQAALSVAQAMEIVQGKEQGMDAVVEQGAGISGGQRQRLTIARALVRQPEILILDDSASALDYATDARLRAAIGALENPPTTFVVSQRAASIRTADWILVLDDGRVVGQGTHEALLRTCEIYQEIYYSQFQKEVERRVP